MIEILVPRENLCCIAAISTERRSEDNMRAERANPPGAEKSAADDPQRGHGEVIVARQGSRGPTRGQVWWAWPREHAGLASRIRPGAPERRDGPFVAPRTDQSLARSW